MVNSHDDRLPPYLRIANQIRRQIASGHYEVGDRLTKQELAEEHGVAGMTVDRALELLRDEGIIETRRGVGSFVLAKPDARTGPEAPAERSEEFRVLSAQLNDIRTSLRSLSSRVDELDRRTKDQQ